MNIFCALVLLSVIRYRQGSISIEKKEWDLQTVTASDYTLEIRFDKRDYQKMKQDLANDTYFHPYESDGLRMKLYFKKKLEECINEISGGNDGKIADINFAYYNSWLIDDLRERGQFIIQQ